MLKLWNRIRQNRIARKLSQALMIIVIIILAWSLWSGSKLSAINGNVIFLSGEKVHNYQYMYGFAAITNNTTNAARITEIILSNCYEVGMSRQQIELVSHIVWKESRYRTNAVGYRKDENGKWMESDYGLFQICLDYHSNEIKALTNKFKNICVDHWWGMRMALMNPEVNSYYAVRLLKKRLDINGGDIRLTLTDWNHGPWSEAKSNIFHHGIGNAYEQSFANSDRFLRQVKAYGWKLTNVSPPLYLAKI